MITEKVVDNSNELSVSNLMPFKVGRVMATFEKIEMGASDQSSVHMDDNIQNASHCPASILPRLLDWHVRYNQRGSSEDILIEELMANLERIPQKFTYDQSCLYYLGYYSQRKMFRESQDLK